LETPSPQATRSGRRIRAGGLVCLMGYSLTRVLHQRRSINYYIYNGNLMRPGTVANPSITTTFLGTEKLFINSPLMELLTVEDPGSSAIP
jgi:hypothetical protein